MGKIPRKILEKALKLLQKIFFSREIVFEFEFSLQKIQMIFTHMPLSSYRKQTVAPEMELAPKFKYQHINKLQIRFDNK